MPPIVDMALIAYAAGVAASAGLSILVASEAEGYGQATVGGAILLVIVFSALSWFGFGILLGWGVVDWRETGG